MIKIYTSRNKDEWTYFQYIEAAIGGVIKKAVLKIFAILTGKHLCWILFLTKLQPFRPVILIKKDSNIDFSCQYWEIFKDTFFIEHVRTTASTYLKSSDEVL